MTELSQNTDLEFDSLQPCFYPDEDDFYSWGPDSSPPGQDIWKKFELLPSRSLSPSQASLQSVSACPGRWPLLDDGLSAAGDSLDWASELLLLPPESDLLVGSDWGWVQNTELGMSPRNLKSLIVQDCMWSDFSAREKLEGALSEKWGRTVEATNTTHPGALTASSITWLGDDLNNPATHCVDPAVVSPLPASNIRGVLAGSLCSVSPPSSAPSTAPSRGNAQTCPGWESRSESDYEVDDEEEIDVVTVEKRQTSSKSVTSLRITVSSKKAKPSQGKAAQSDLILRRYASVHQQHNYATPFPYAEPEEEVPQPKKLKSEVPRVVKSIRTQSPGTYSQDHWRRRKSHNVLERRRRSELKSRLLTLKDHVPHFTKNVKAAKKVILKKATEYILSLRAAEKKLSQEKEKLLLRQRRLRKNIQRAKAG